eukprot:gb/GECG01001377.1/.p1 GENE.gb/GECG01001377.1/~~gb/GECG01001377.1/.p1  ORF type:complete len:117 (+),score=16.50 gb/GECG01001377.1/:1-351(+)
MESGSTWVLEQKYNIMAKAFTLWNTKLSDKQATQLREKASFLRYFCGTLREAGSIVASRQRGTKYIREFTLQLATYVKMKRELNHKDIEVDIEFPIVWYDEEKKSNEAKGATRLLY